MSRISRTELFFEVALTMAKRSTCNRAKVGCVVVKDNRIIATGYNGALPNDSHCNSLDCNDTKPCSNTIHAEMNAISYAAKKGIALDKSILYSTHLPCPICAKLIVQAGITSVYYIHAYRDISGLHLLINQGIECFPIAKISHD